MADLDEPEPREFQRVPATILTGFLGSGKTTLLNHILTATHGKKIAIIENEFGETSIDDALIQKNSKFQSEEEIVEVLNGCICCSVRQDLVVILEKLARRVQEGSLFLDAIVIETTGMADPAPVAQTFLVHDSIKAFFRLDGIVTLVDAKHVEQHLDEKKPEGVVNEALAQVAFADRLLLNKCDLVSPDDLDRIQGRLRGINHVAPIDRCTKSEVSVDRVLNIHGFDLQRALKASPQLLDTSAQLTQHDGTVSSVSLDQGAPRHMRLVQKGDLDLALVQEWINELLQNDGEDLFRMKGVLCIAHAPQRFVYHAVHMTFSGGFEEAWAADEPRESKMVFIGKNLDAKALAARFDACLVTPENMQRKADAFRFRVGDQVECNMGGGEWAAGVVHALLYRDECLPPGVVAPYQVQLTAPEEDGRLIFAPTDHACTIRARRPSDEAKVAEVARRLMQLEVSQLASLLRELELPQEGTKEELVTRLVDNARAASARAASARAASMRPSAAEDEQGTSDEDEESEDATEVLGDVALAMAQQGRGHAAHGHSHSDA